ncbi:MAG: hypothetical protein K1060chlam2_00208 [Chlamydiae bacterium]|nr:hypothetical protein [Chlamydiota bacterium]
MPNLTPEEMNAQGQKILEEILNDPDKKIYRMSNGSIKIFIEDGRGAHFKDNDTFLGFIERVSMSQSFTIELSSNVDFEGMVVYISSGEQEFFLLNYDKGVENIEIEPLPHTITEKKQIFQLEELLDALIKAKEILIKCAEEDKTRERY